MDGIQNDITLEHSDNITVDEIEKLTWLVCWTDSELMIRYTWSITLSHLFSFIKFDILSAYHEKKYRDLICV